MDSEQSKPQGVPQQTLGKEDCFYSTLAPLNQGRREIRLLKIDPGENFSTISATVSIISLDDGSDWDALSYCWGNPNLTTLILVNDKPFHATKNLESALQQLRANGYSRWIWIDAICINQRDINEKNCQVPLMADIYASAGHVAIWLGIGTEATDKFMNEVKEISSAKNQFEQLIQTKLRHVYQFPAALLRPWWTRIWVLQETVLAKDPWLICGTKTLNWNSLSMVSQLLDDDKLAAFSNKMDPDAWGAWMDELAKLVRAENPLYTEPNQHAAWMWCLSRLKRLKSLRENAWGSGKEGGKESGSMSLIAALTLTIQQLASDPHDKIYGLLGLVQRNERDRIKVDYQEPVMTTYHEATVVALTGNRLGFLNFFGYPSSHDGTTPSWVPDFRKEPLIMTTNLQSTRFIQLPDAVEISEDKKFVVAPCIYLDTVGFAVRLGAEDLTTFRSNIQSFVKATSREVAYGEGIQMLRDQQQIYELGSPLWQTVVLASETSPQKELNPDNCRIMWEAWTDPRYPDTWPPSALKAPKDCGDPAKWIESVCAMFLRRFEKIRSGYFSRDRAVFQTSTGFFGLAPDSITPGDILVIFRNAQSIMALHTDGPHYTFVGGVYLHGITGKVKTEEVQQLYEQGVLAKRVVKVG